MFKDVKTIILETNENCLIGGINEFQVFNNYLFILDRISAKSLYIFDKSGHFVRKIGQLGKGPGEYIKVIDFTIDTKNGIIYLLDFHYKILKYKIDGTFIQSFRIDLPDTNVQNIQYYNERLYVDALKYKPTKDDYMLFEIDVTTGKVLSQSLPVILNKGFTESFFPGHSFFLSRLTTTPPKYAQWFMDDIISISDYPKSHLLLQSKNLTTKKDIDKLQDGTDVIEKVKRLEALKETSKIYNIHNYIEHGNLIFFEYQQGKESHSVLYNTNSQETQIAEYTANDLVYQDSTIRNHIRIMFFDQHGVYDVPATGWVNSLQDFFIKQNKLATRLDKLDQLKQLPEDSNPVIFYYEFKDE
ncbi:hypothetical protein FACS189464_3470 [Bacteroidia bacterium]|nr:hypothetical protein FACS189464_3470 [Bacteroidia bacterium]